MTTNRANTVWSSFCRLSLAVPKWPCHCFGSLNVGSRHICSATPRTTPVWGKIFRHRMRRKCCSRRALDSNLQFILLLVLICCNLMANHLKVARGLLFSSFWSPNSASTLSCGMLILTCWSRLSLSSTLLDSVLHCVMHYCDQVCRRGCYKTTVLTESLSCWKLIQNTRWL